MLYEKTTQIILITVTTTFRFISSEQGLLLAYLYVQHQHADSTFRNQRKEVHLHGICHLFLRELFLKRKRKKKKKDYGLLEFPKADLSLLIMH